MTLNPAHSGNVFAYLTAIPGLAWAMGMAVLIGGSPGSWVVFGAIFGLIIAAIGTPKLTGDTRVVPYSDKDQFVANLNVACAQSGYEPNPSVNDFLAFGPNEKSSFTIGPIKMAPASFLRLGVQLEPNQAKLVGPRVLVTRLQQQLS